MDAHTPIFCEPAAERKFGPIAYTDFPKYAIKVFLYRAGCQAELKSDFFVRFRLLDKLHNLTFAERKPSLTR